MTTLEFPSAPARFSTVLDGLCRAVAARIARHGREGGLSAALIVLIWGRIRRIETRVTALIAAIEAGRVRVRVRVRAVRRHEGLAGVGGVADGGARSALTPGGIGGPSHAGARRLPRRVGWLLGLVPYEAAGFAGQLRAVLEDPEMVALLAATPRMGALLRPLCRMLGLDAALVSPAVLGGLGVTGVAVAADGLGARHVSDGPDDPAGPGTALAGGAELGDRTGGVWRNRDGP